MKAQDRVIVAGGGIGGLAVGSALQRAGVPFVILEGVDELREIGAAIGVQTNAVRALRGIGLAEVLIEFGVPIEFYEYYSWRGRRLVRWSQGEIGRMLGEPTVVVHRGDLQRILRSGVPESSLKLGSTCVDFEQDEEGVTVRTETGQEYRGGLLIGADGLRSMVRRRLLGEGPLRYSGWTAYRGITQFSDEGFPVGLARQVLGAGLTFGMWHLSGGRVYWVATVREPEGREVESGFRRGHILDRFSSTVPQVAELVKATDEEAILRNAVYDRVPVETWSSGRVTLLGDAAHPTTPVTGQGGGQAIIDAAVLSEQIADSGLSDLARLGVALKSYEARRIGVTSSITTEAWRISAMHHFSSPLAVWARDLSFKWTPTRVWHKRMEERLAF